VTTTPTRTTLTAEQEALLVMAAYVQARREAQNTKKTQDLFGERLKAYLETNGPLYDGETGYEARLLERQGPATFDVEKMPDALVLWLARHGALNVDAKVALALKGRSSEADALYRLIMPGKPTTALDVKKRHEE